MATTNINKKLKLKDKRHLFGFLTCQPRSGFTIIELLISIAIMGLLTALFVTNFDRATAGNRVSGDIEVFQAKLNQTRLLAGATENNQNQVSYYALYLPKSYGTYNFYRIVRITSLSPDATACPLNKVITYPLPANDPCAVEQVGFSPGVQMRFPPGRFPGPSSDPAVIFAFKVPTQEIFRIDYDPTTKSGTLVMPEFDCFALDYNQFNYGSRATTGIAGISSYNTRVQAKYFNYTARVDSQPTIEGPDGQPCNGLRGVGN